MTLIPREPSQESSSVSPVPRLLNRSWAMSVASHREQRRQKIGTCNSTSRKVKISVPRECFQKRPGNLMMVSVGPRQPLAKLSYSHSLSQKPCDLKQVTLCLCDLSSSESFFSPHFLFFWVWNIRGIFNSLRVYTPSDEPYKQNFFLKATPK